MLYSSEKISQLFLRALPALCLLFMVILGGAEPFILERLSITLFLSWAGTYYWSLFRPQILPYSYLFLLGLVQDIVTGLPIGLSSFLIIAMRLIINKLKHLMTVDHFWAIWIGFLITSIICAISAFALISLIKTEWMFDDLGQLLLNAIITWVFYPIIHLIFNRTYSLLPNLHMRNHTL